MTSETEMRPGQGDLREREIEFAKLIMSGAKIRCQICNETIAVPVPREKDDPKNTRQLTWVCADCWGETEELKKRLGGTPDPTAGTEIRYHGGRFHGGEW